MYELDPQQGKIIAEGLHSLNDGSMLKLANQMYDALCKAGKNSAMDQYKKNMQDFADMYNSSIKGSLASATEAMEAFTNFAEFQANLEVGGAASDMGGVSSEEQTTAFSGYDSI